jgi:DNA gyrase subunit A
VINRQSASQIRVIGRNTQGVRLVSLDTGDEVMDVAKIIPDLGDTELDGLVLGDEDADPGDSEVASIAPVKGLPAEIPES